MSDKSTWGSLVDLGTAMVSALNGEPCNQLQNKETYLPNTTIKAHPLKDKEPGGHIDARLDLALSRFKPGAGQFLIEPYLQLGSDPSTSIEILWAMPATDKRVCELEIDPSDAKFSVTKRTINLEGLVRHILYIAKLSGYKPGALVSYRMKLDGKIVFTASAKTPLPRQSDSQRFVVVGDIGEESKGQKKIANLIWKENPDILSVVGDVVYPRGRALEYLARLFPIYNSSRTGAEHGAPIMRSTLMFSSPGNHCMGKLTEYMQDSLNWFPDLFGYFHYLSLPLNGPKRLEDKTSIPVVRGKRNRVREFLKSAGDRFPNQANYSFTFGNVFWLVIDGNAYMDWSEPMLQEWVEKTLAKAKSDPSIKWRFVNVHHPLFTSEPKHQAGARVRVLCHLFQKYGVHVVFSGDAHWYERTYPMSVSSYDKEGQKATQVRFDRRFDGDAHRVPDGVLYIVSGAGGGQLNDSNVSRDPNLWASFTYKLIADRHSFTVCDTQGDSLTIRQIDEDGLELDRIIVEQKSQ